MNRRFLTLTVTISLDDDLCNAADTPAPAAGFSAYQDAIDAVRTTVAHDVAAQLAPLDPGIDITVTYDGVISLGSDAVNHEGLHS